MIGLIIKNRQLILLILSLPCLYQISINNSFASALQKNSNDSLMVTKMLKDAITLREVFPDSAMNIALKALIHSNNIKNVYLKACSLKEIGVINKIKGKYNSAIDYQNQALSFFLSINNSEGIANCNFGLGNAFKSIGKFELALKHYLKCLKYRESVRDSLGMVNVYNNIGTLYSNLENFDLAIGYFNKCLGIQHKVQDTLGLIRTFLNLSGLYIEKQDHLSSLEFIEKCKKLSVMKRDSSNLSIIYNTLGINYDHLKNYELAKVNYRKSIAYFKKENDMYGLGLCLHNLGLISLQEKNYNLAVIYGNESLKIFEELNSNDNRMKALYILSEAYYGLNKVKNALKFYKKYIEVKDSVLDLNKAQQLAELQVKYETEKKDDNIKLLATKNQLQSTLNESIKTERNTFITIAIIIFILTIIIVVFYQQRQNALKVIAAKTEEINNKKINELLKEQEIRSINSMIQGQEEERKRIAVELHDRLGIILTSVKRYVEVWEEKLESFGQKNIDQYNTVNNILDQSIREVREIAHDMVSGTLDKFGLVSALKDLKYTLEGTGSIKVNLLIYNLNNRLEGKVELKIYRVIQELVSNILKHAKANEIMIQLNKHNNDLIIMVEDDGVGFEANNLERQNGMGLKNVESRVKSLQGKLSIDSAISRGTITTIEIPI